jgi:hypothetical protein
MTNSELFGRWSARISDGIDLLEPRQKLWDKYLRYYRMDLTQEEMIGSEEDNVFTNYMFGLSRIILPSIYFTNPRINVLPKGRTPSDVAHINEQLLQYQMEELGMETEFRRCIFDALMTGLGVIKVGFAPKMESLQSRRKDPFDIDRDEVLDMMREELGEAGVTDSRVTSTMPFLLQIDSRFMLFDPLANCLDNSRYVIQTIPRVVDDVRKDRKYARDVAAGVQATSSLKKLMSEEGIGYDFTGDSAYTNIDDELVMIYEIWDRENQEYLVMDSYNFTQNTGKLLSKKPWPYELTDFPFEVLTFNPDPSSIYGVPDAATWFNLSEALNLVDTMQYNHIKRFQRKYLLRKGMLDEGRMDDLLSPRDGAIVEINGDPEHDLVPLRDAPVTPDMYGLREILKDNLSMLSGATGQRRGESERARTATEASIIEQQARIRESDRLYQVSMVVRDALRKFHQLNREFLSSSDVAEFTQDPDAMAMWSSQSGAILNAEVDVSIHIGSSAFKSKEVQVKQYIDYLNIVSKIQETDPNTGLPVNVVDLRLLAKRIAEAMDIPDFKEFFETRSVPPIDPNSLMPQMPGGNGGANPLQSGTPSLGSQLSRVQNLGVRRTPPNPTMEG